MPQWATCPKKIRPHQGHQWYPDEKQLQQNDISSNTALLVKFQVTFVCTDVCALSMLNTIVLPKHYEELKLYLGSVYSDLSQSSNAHSTYVHIWQ